MLQKEAIKSHARLRQCCLHCLVLHTLTNGVDCQCIGIHATPPGSVKTHLHAHSLGRMRHTPLQITSPPNNPLTNWSPLSHPTIVTRQSPD